MTIPIAIGVIVFVCILSYTVRSKFSYLLLTLNTLAIIVLATVLIIQRASHYKVPEDFISNVCFSSIIVAVIMWLPVLLRTEKKIAPDEKS